MAMGAASALRPPRERIHSSSSQEYTRSQMTEPVRGGVSAWTA